LSQPVGVTYKTRIPTLSDDASIEEALRVYHYGIDNYSSQQIPADSIEGNFNAVNNRVDTVESTIQNLNVIFIEATSSSSDPNIIVPQTSSTVPLTIRGASSQTANLQRWQNSAGTSLAAVFSDGAISTSGYISSGVNSQSTTIAADIRIKNAAHKGVTVRAASSQSANLQEWQNSGGTDLASISSNGSFNTSANLTVSGNASVDGDIVLQGKKIENFSPFLLMGS
jgi:hypothetical protein